MLFWLSETGRIWGSQAFWSCSVNFPHYGDPLAVIGHIWGFWALSGVWEWMSKGGRRHISDALRRVLSSSQIMLYISFNVYKRTVFHYMFLYNWRFLMFALILGDIFAWFNPAKLYQINSYTKLGVSPGYTSTRISVIQYVFIIVWMVSFVIIICRQIRPCVTAVLSREISSLIILLGSRWEENVW